MKVKAFIDTNAFIYGFEEKNSNSVKILEMLNEDKIEAYINLTVVKEIASYFKRNYSRAVANKFMKYLLESCTLVFEDDYKEEAIKLKGQIKTKDLPQIAATKALGIKYLISFDRDFKPFSEYRTPKNFLKELGLKQKETEY